MKELLKPRPWYILTFWKWMFNLNKLKEKIKSPEFKWQCHQWYLKNDTWIDIIVAVGGFGTMFTGTIILLVITGTFVWWTFITGASIIILWIILGDFCD